MKKLGSRLTYANVMSSLAVFLVLGGATAFAASQLGKNSVGSAQLKRNAVTGVKIKKGTITGSDIRARNTPFSQIVGRVVGTGTNTFKTGNLYQLSNPTYTQPAKRADQYIGGMTVNFAATCEAPRSAVAYLLIDAANPAAPESSDVAGLGQLVDKGTGAVTRLMTFSPYVGLGGMSRVAPGAATQHTFSIYMAGETCKTGSGVTASGAQIDIIGTK